MRPNGGGHRRSARSGPRYARLPSRRTTALHDSPGALAIDPFNETLHPLPLAAIESLPRESHEARRFHTARVKTGKAQHEHMTSALPFKPDILEQAMPRQLKCQTRKSGSF
jgi:hypothetical protein